MKPTLHPRNKDFSWSTISTRPRRLVSEAQARQFDEEGYFILANAFSDEEVGAVAAAIDPIEHEAELLLKRDYGGQIKIAKADAITFTLHLVAKSSVLKAFSRHRIFAGLCHDLIGEKSRLYWDQAVYKKPGNPEEFPWHQDNGYTFVEPQQYLTCWVALNDATIDNGCPWVVPGMHRLGTLLHKETPLGQQCLEEPENAVAAPVAKGGVVVFSSLTPHRTGPNLTKGARKSYILQYAADGAVAYSPETGNAITLRNPERQYLI
jgi:ectoine hydroxylase-related dioxygenase (phytanoyl-CoA dioxygenase family)